MRKIPKPISDRVGRFYDAGAAGRRPSAMVSGSIDESAWQAGVDASDRTDVVQHFGETLGLWKRLGSGITWCHGTFNWWSGCVKTSPGCKFCFAEELVVVRGGRKLWGRKAPRPRTGRAVWQAFQKFRRLQDDPAWRIEVGLKEGERPRVFVGSIMDVGEARDDEMLAIVADGFDVVREADDVDWLFLTKRPQNVPELLPSDWGSGWPHCWWMTSIESGEASVRDAELGAPVLERVKYLLEIPAVVHGVSYEPAIGPLAEALRPAMEKIGPGCVNQKRVDWVIYGGESGKNFRPEGTAEDPKIWAREMRDACLDLDVRFLHKQSADRRNEQGVRLDGHLHREYPASVYSPSGAPPTTLRRDDPLPAKGQGLLFDLVRQGAT